MDASNTTLNDLCSSIGAVNMDAEKVNDPHQKFKVEKVDELWQMEMTCLSEQNLFVFYNSIRVDCTFVVGEPTGEVQKFGLHRYVMSNASPVFDRMLNGKMAEQDVHIPDIEPQTFKHLITFIYSGTLDLSTMNVEMAMKICLAAEKYVILTLKTKCSDHLIKLIGPDDIFKSLQFASLLHMGQLADRARKILIERTDEVLAAPTFQEQFNECSEVLVLELVQQPELNIDSEVNLISAVLSWAQHQVLENDLSADEPENYKEVLGIILEHLRFFSLTPKEFAQLDSALSLIFTLDEKYNMTLQISLGDFSKIPDTLSHNIEKRTKTVIEVPKFLLCHEIPLIDKFTECECCYNSFEGTLGQLYFSHHHNVNPTIRNQPKCILYFKVNSNVRVHGLYILRVWAWKNVSIFVFRDQNIPVPIGTCKIQNSEVLFQSPFIANANEMYTILLTWEDNPNADYNMSMPTIAKNLFTDLIYSEQIQGVVIRHMLFKKT